MSDTVRVTEVLKKKLSSVPVVEEGDLTTEDMLIGLKSDDNKKTVQIPVSVLLRIIDTELLTNLLNRVDTELLTDIRGRLAHLEDANIGKP